MLLFVELACCCLVSDVVRCVLFVVCCLVVSVLLFVVGCRSALVFFSMYADGRR